MRRSANNNGSALTPAGSWQRRNMDRGSSNSPDREEQGRAAVTTPPPRLQPESGRFSGPWTLFEERVRTGPFGLSRFPTQPHSPVRILILDTDVIGAGEVDPALRMFVRNYSPPRIRGEWHLQVEAEPEDPGLTEEEFKKAMKKMRKHVHNPTYPRRRAWRRGLFNSRSVADGEADDDQKEESKDCAVCLETFAANEQVMMTPCNHMFHNDCIVPWVKSRGQCPVCRLELCERSQQQRRRQRENTAPAVRRGGGNAGEAVWDDELFYLIRAMEEAFNWINLTR
ncbi:hypothetical protein Taro_024228 [Colocasia esculenta]|uniref:RING-type domain-containing protein n=1 Tax=Colocasia esculenta TaxID=4460 RepID=A0A843VDV7_COLES|nr:hypothetical protein [Colocasia esculenta]